MRMQRDYLIDLEDAVVAVKEKDGKVKLNQIHKLTQAGATSGGFWGALIGMLFSTRCSARPLAPGLGPFPALWRMWASTTTS